MQLASVSRLLCNAPYQDISNGKELPTTNTHMHNFEQTSEQCWRGGGDTTLQPK